MAIFIDVFAGGQIHIFRNQQYKGGQEVFAYLLQNIAGDLENKADILFHDSLYTCRDVHIELDLWQWLQWYQ